MTADQESADQLQSSDRSNSESPDVAIRMVNYDDIVPQFANDVYISADPMGLQLVFSRYFPPPLIGPADEEGLRIQGFVPNPVVARIVLPGLLVERLISLLPERLERHHELAAEYSSWVRGEVEGADGDDEDGDREDGED